MGAGDDGVGGGFPVRLRGRPILLLAAALGFCVVAAGTVRGTETALRITDAAVWGLLAITVVALLGLVRAWWRSDREARVRLLWPAFGALLAVVIVAVGFAVAPWAAPWVQSTLEATALAVIPISVGLGILRSGLFDIAAVLNRAIVYAVLTGLVVLVYFAVLAIATGALGPDAGRGASLLASAAIAVFLAPLKNRLQRVVDRALYGDRAEPYRVLAGLAAKLEHTTAVDDLVATVSQTVRSALKVPYVEVVLGDDRPVPAGAEVLPLISHGRSEGALVVGRRAGQQSFAPAEQRLLEVLAGQVAREVRGTRLARDLQESRDEIIRAREAERLRIRRDLHDGVGPTLAAARLQVDALRERWTPTDPKAIALLDKVQAEIAHSVTEIRHVVDGLRPPALDDLGLVGLVGVIREQIGALAATGLTVRFDHPSDLAAGVPAVDVAAYRIVSEALTNVARHADATTCHVALAVQDGSLTVMVGDDGVGVRRPDGVGMASMRERAAELGGTLDVGVSDLGGTLVSATLPMGGVR